MEKFRFVEFFADYPWSLIQNLFAALSNLKCWQMLPTLLRDRSQSF